MKDKKTLSIGARCRVKDIEQLEGTVVSDTGIVVEESDAAVKVHHDHWPKDEWYLREQCRRLRKKPRPAKEERVEIWITQHAKRLVSQAALTSVTHVAVTKFPVSDGSKVFLTELRPGETIVSREKLADIREGLALMAEGEGSDPTVYMDMSRHWMKQMDDLGLKEPK